MTNDQVALVLRLRDEATAVWQKFQTTVAGGASNMAATLKAHWLSISITAIAAFKAIEKAWDFAKLFAETQSLKASFNSMLQGMGKNAEDTFRKVMKASAGLIDDSDLLKASNLFISLGGNADKLGDLMLIARAKARDMGITVREAYEKITEGVGKARERSLLAVGISIELKTAQEQLASSLGKTVQQLTKAEEKQAFLNATLLAGADAVKRQNFELMTLSEQIQTIQTFIANAKESIGEFAVRAAALIIGTLNYISAGFYQLAFNVLVPLAKIEEGMRALGITSSFMVAHLRDDVADLYNHFNTKGKEAFDLLTASSAALGQALGATGQQATETGTEVAAATGSLKAMREEMAAIPATEITFVNPAQESAFKKAFDNMKRMQDFMKQSSAVRRALVAQNMAADIQATMNTTKAVFVETTAIDAAFTEMIDKQTNDFKEKQQAVAGFMQDLAGVMGASFTDMFSGTEAAGKAFLKRILIMIIDMVQGALLAAAAMAPLKGVLSFGITAAPDITALLAGTALLQLARAYVSSFHQGTGGPVFFDAPASRNIPIMVRGGETFEVKTEAQQRQGSSSRITYNNVHVHGPIASKEAFKKLVEEGMRELGVTDVRQYFRNTNGDVTL